MDRQHTGKCGNICLMASGATWEEWEVMAWVGWRMSWKRWNMRVLREAGSICLGGDYRTSPCLFSPGLVGKGFAWVSDSECGDKEMFWLVEAMGCGQNPGAGHGGLYVAVEQNIFFEWQTYCSRKVRREGERERKGGIYMVYLMYGFYMISFTSSFLNPWVDNNSYHSLSAFRHFSGWIVRILLVENDRKCLKVLNKRNFMGRTTKIV